MVWGLLVGALLMGAPAQGEAPPSPKAKATKIAVLDVHYAGVGDRKTVEGLSSLLASEVARRPSLAVVAGADLRALVGFERQRQLLGCTETGCLTELAGALGVTYLVSSECSKVGNTWLISLTLLDANKSTALSRLTRRAYSDDGLVDEIPRAVDELLAALPGLPPVPPREALAPGSRPEPVAPPPPPGPSAAQAGYHRHDGGFLRLQGGGGGTQSTTSGLKVSGASAAFSLAAGYAVVDNLVVFGEFFGDKDASPKFNGQTPPAGTSASHDLIGYGVGGAYYLMPLNAYASVTVGAGQAGITVSNGVVTLTGKTKTGPMVRLSVGKEWWVSTDWGLGASFNFVAGSMKDEGATPATWKSTAWSLALSATYN